MFNILTTLLRVLAIITAGLVVLSLPSCSDSTEIYTVETRVTATGAVLKRPKVVMRRQLLRAAAAPGPRASLSCPVHDFGQMDPLTQGTHAFVIENTGDAVLELRQGPTTCKCTLSKLERTVLEPGESAKAIVTWNSGRNAHYRHQATIFTNDPRNQAITLTIQGRVRVLLGCEPAELVFSRIAPGQMREATTIVYSQNWNAMKLTSVHAAMRGWNWHVESASDRALDSLRAKCGYRLTVSSPKGIQPGYFMTSVSLEAEQLNAPEGERPETGRCELAVSGKALRRLSVSGPAIDATGKVSFGCVTKGKGARVRLLMKIRDDLKTLAVRHVQCAPAFLKVLVEPYKKNGAKIGLYQLLIDVPKDAPTFYLPPNELGNIQITFDHPRVKQLTLKVDLEVMTPSSPVRLHGQ